MNIPSLRTPHLLLRAWTPDDAETWFSIMQEDGILRYFQNPAPPPREKADAYMARHLAHWEQYGYGHWAVVTQDDALIVGWTGLEHLRELGETEVAYLLSKRVWGHGYASEAACAAIRFGFETVRLDSIIGLVAEDNSASIRVLEKCGLRFADRVTVWGMSLRRYRIQRLPEATDAASTQGSLPLR